MATDIIGPFSNASATIDVIDLPFTLSEMEEVVTKPDDSEEIEYSSIGDECFNFPDDETNGDSIIQYSEIEIDSDAIRKLMFD